jgi:hypothetical protein
MGRNGLKKLNEIEVNEHTQAKITNKFAAFRSLDDDVDVSRARETIRGNVRISAKRV